MPVAPRRPADLHRRVFRGSEMVTAGRLTVGELRSSAWRRLFHDVYACAELPITHQVRAVAASRLVLPGSVVTGRSAAMLWGVLDDDLHAPIELTISRGSTVHRVPGIVVRRRALDPQHVRMRNGVRTTSAEWTAVDLARTGPLDDAVVLIDQFVEAKVTVLEDIAALAATTTGRGCRQVREAVRLADGKAGSPPETRLRLALRRPGLPAGSRRELARGGGQGGPSLRLARSSDRRRVRGHLARRDAAAGGRRSAAAQPAHRGRLDGHFRYR